MNTEALYVSIFRFVNHKPLPKTQFNRGKTAAMAFIRVGSIAGQKKYNLIIEYKILFDDEGIITDNLL